MTIEEMESRFSYHKPIGTQPDRYTRIREEAKKLAWFINEYCPESRESALAFTKLEEAVFWANAAIARRETDADQASAA